MFSVFLYSVHLVCGIFCSQFFNLFDLQEVLRLFVEVTLAYIMLEVGLVFTFDKECLPEHGRDQLFAFIAAVLPWFLCAIYFVYFVGADWKQAFLLGIFAAPTSVGVLFAMFDAAGLGATWVFRKTQALAVFNDFNVLVLLIPLQIILAGFQLKLLAVFVLMAMFLAIAFFRLHSMNLPSTRPWLVIYGALIVIALKFLQDSTDISLGVLVPAFALGAILLPPRKDLKVKPLEREKYAALDYFVKSLFMFLVGCSLPQSQASCSIDIWAFLFHVLMLTVLSNLGKSFLFFCYQKEASREERLALSVAMFPRGEIGAGVLLVAMGYSANACLVSLSILSLALNFVLTGVFIGFVIWMVGIKKVEDT